MNKEPAIKVKTVGTVHAESIRYRLQSDAMSKIDAMIGKDMRMWDGTGTGRNTADLRKQTGQERVNDRFDVAIVPAGKYKQVNERFHGNQFKPEILDEKDVV